MKRYIYSSTESVPEELSSRPYVFTLNSVNSTYNDDILYIAEKNGAIKVKYQGVNPKTNKLFKEGYWKFAVKTKDIAENIFDEVIESNIPVRQNEISIVETDWTSNYNIYVDDYDKGVHKVKYNANYSK